MKAVLISIQPRYVFLIIARQMGWDIPVEKTVEVRKTYPTSDDWNRKVIIYCSRNMKSFNRIPKEYQPLMRPLLGKVIGEFVCGDVRLNYAGVDGLADVIDCKQSCLTAREMIEYSNGKILYNWHISDLVIYDKPKELSEFRQCHKCEYGPIERCNQHEFSCDGTYKITRPPQSWCYVEVSEMNLEKILFDKATIDWFRKHTGHRTTVVQCEECGLYFKPSLGHRCKRRKEMNCNDRIRKN